MGWALLYFFGICLNILQYDSFYPAVVSLIYAVFVLSVLILFFNKDKIIWPSAVKVYFALTFWHGFASIYAGGYFFSHGDDPIKLYELAISEVSINELLLMENGASLSLFKFFYDVFLFINIPSEHFIGSMLNISLVTLSFVVGYKVISLMRPITLKDIHWYRNIYLTSGMFILFAAIHLREALIQLSFILLILLWVSSLENVSLKKIVLISLFTIITIPYFKLLRTEFEFAPIVIILSAYLSLFLSDESKRLKISLIFFIFLSSAFMLFFNYQEVALFYTKFETVGFNGVNSYLAANDLESSSDSLGNNLIMQQPMYIKLFLANAYLFLSPFPFYQGIFSLSNDSEAYFLFKSLHALQMIFVVPYFLLTLRNIFKMKYFRNTSTLFLTTLFVGFTSAVALTSLETRHHGIFILLMFILMIIYGPKWREYKGYLLIYLIAIFFLALIYFFLKL